MKLVFATAMLERLFDHKVYYDSLTNLEIQLFLKNDSLSFAPMLIWVASKCRAWDENLGAGCLFNRSYLKRRERESWESEAGREDEQVTATTDGSVLQFTPEAHRTPPAIMHPTEEGPSSHH